MPSAMTASSMSLRTLAPQSEMSSLSSRNSRRVRLRESCRASAGRRRTAAPAGRAAACRGDCAKRRNASVELGAHVLGLQDGDAGVQVVLVLDAARRTAWPPRAAPAGGAARPPSGVIAPLHVRRREDGQRLLERLGHAPVVDDQAVRLLLVGGAVHARDGLQQRVLLERRVQVHHLLDRAHRSR